MGQFAYGFAGPNYLAHTAYSNTTRAAGKGNRGGASKDFTRTRVDISNRKANKMDDGNNGMFRGRQYRGVKNKSLKFGLN